MPSTCTINKCKHTSYAICHCCQQNICRIHLKEHQDLFISQLDPFVNQINILENRVNTMEIENIIDIVRKRLEQWRIDCYKKIDKFIEEKCYQLTQYMNIKIDKQRENIDEIRSKLTKLIYKQEVTFQYIDSLKYKINALAKEINKIEQTSFDIQIQSFITNDNLIRIKESNPYQFDLSSLSPIIKTINCTKRNWAALATNEKFLLIHQESYLCLVDQEFTIIKKTLWSFGEIWDMFWSSVLERFILINEKNVFLLDENKMSIENIQIATKYNWCCGTCSNKSLYLATYKRGSSIIELKLSPSIEFVKLWKSPDTCSKDEGIHDLIYNDEKLLFIIENQLERRIRVELRSSKTLNCLWFLPLDSADNQKVQIRCCIFNYDEWIVVYHDLSRLLHLTKDGRLKGSCSYTPSPHFASTFGSNLFVVATSNSINLHQIQL
ncbi:unnamed protein product [Rotaria sordida]|uniref:B box-type domain-containing protein n=1 Tax=Rotaria sordida TaxID=392033 RepID=A0A813PBF5_9BILA|nr:unnamed protein product [Rotaria sordida]CAF3540213.1 unnamed protein product [Rotaria sordida]